MSRTILVVEDSQVDRTSTGYLVTTAENGEQVTKPLTDEQLLSQVRAL